MVIRRALSLFLTGMAGLANAGPPLQTLWETPAVFRQPESALPNPGRGRIFVSNIDGRPDEKDGKGFISLLDQDGEIRHLEWVSGLNAPKGMALVGNRLFVADIDELVEIDVRKGVVLQRHSASGAKFLSDVCADSAGRIYVSDMFANRIYRLDRGRMVTWMESPALETPNGLAVAEGRLFVATWGVIDQEGFATRVPGRVKVISLRTKAIADFGGLTPIGNLDGIEVSPDGSVLVTDWIKGGLLRVRSDGTSVQLDPLAPGSADLGYLPKAGVVLVPMMKDNRVLALRIPH